MSHKVIDNGRFERYYNTRKVKSVMIDARSPDDFAGGHIEGAVNIRLSSPSFPAELKKAAGGGVNLIFIYAGNSDETARLMAVMKNIYSCYIVSSPYGIYYMRDGYKNK